VADRDISLIVGLGNPGKEYEYTRHNLGFMVVGLLCDRYGLRLRHSSFCNAMVAEGTIDGEKVCLLLPLTYMNKSGVAVKAAVCKKGITTENLLIICDDVNLDFGRIRIRRKGSAGGHNGLKSIIQHLATEEFPRLRIGIGPAILCDSSASKGCRCNREAALAHFVLDEFSKQERESLNDFISEAADCCLVWLKYGIVKAMDEYNRRKENGK